MRIDPEPGLALAAREVQFPYPLQRQSVAERDNALTPVTGIAQNGMGIEENAAIRGLRYRRDEGAIWPFARYGRQVAQRCLQRDRDPDKCSARLADTILGQAVAG